MDLDAELRHQPRDMVLLVVFVEGQVERVLEKLDVVRVDDEFVGLGLTLRALIELFRIDLVHSEHIASKLRQIDGPLQETRLIVENRYTGVLHDLLKVFVSLEIYLHIIEIDVGADSREVDAEADL